jgi:hypothetical protein
MTPSVLLVSGFVAVLLGLLASLVAADFKARRYFDRPGLARNRLFDPVLSAAKWALLLAGLALLGRASRRSAVATAALLLVLWAYRRFVRSAGFQLWLLKRDYRELKRRKPGLPDREILCELVYRRNPRWGEELIEQMVIDHPDVESLSRMIARMERGFRGFR